MTFAKFLKLRVGGWVYDPAAGGYPDEDTVVEAINKLTNFQMATLLDDYNNNNNNEGTEQTWYGTLVKKSKAEEDKS